MPYFGASLKSGFQKLSAETVWHETLPKRKLIPAPTGRHALWYFMQFVDLKEGDEVLFAGYNFYIIVRLVVQRGCKPVFVDIDPETLCMDPDDLEKKITPKSRCVMVTHMFGNPGDLTRISEICQKNDLLLFEDCAHAVGTTHNGEQVGQAGDGALFSFGIQKLINSFGGGLLAIKKEWVEGKPLPEHNVGGSGPFFDTFSRVLTSFMTTPKFYGYTYYPGLNFAMKMADNGRPQLKAVLDPSKDDPNYRFEQHSRAPFKPFMLRMHQLQLKRALTNIARRREIIARIKERVAEVPEIKVLNEDKHGQTNASYFGVYASRTKELAQHLAEHGVEANPQEYYNCSQLEQFSEFKADCPHSAYASTHVLRLPSYPWLSDGEVEHIADSIVSFYKSD